MTTPDPWVATSDALLMGMTHALSNRVATVSASASALEEAAETDAALTAALRGEIGRLEEALRAFRLLASNPRGGAVPLHLPDLLPQVVALHAHHALLRDVPCELRVEGDVPPVLACEGAVARALLVLLSDAKQDAVRAAGVGARVAIVVSGDDTQARVAFRVASRPTRDDGAGDASVATAERLLAPAHGEVRREAAGDVVLTLASLRDARRRARDAR